MEYKVSPMAGPGAPAPTAQAPSQPTQSTQAAQSPQPGGEQSGSTSQQIMPSSGPQLFQNSEINTDQARKMADWCVEFGMTREVADAKLKAEGIDPVGQAPVLDPNSFEATFDKNFPAAKPHEYSLPRIADGADQAQVEMEHSAFRGWLAAAELPMELGNSLIRNADRDRLELAKMKTPIEITSWANRQENDLKRVWGEQYQSNLDLAKKFLGQIEAKSPGVKEFLGHTGLSHSASVIVSLYNQAQRITARRGKL